jgi:hypothetical protein
LIFFLCTLWKGQKIREKALTFQTKKAFLYWYCKEVSEYEDKVHYNFYVDLSHLGVILSGAVPGSHAMYHASTSGPLYAGWAFSLLCEVRMVLGN